MNSVKKIFPIISLPFIIPLKNDVAFMHSIEILMHFDSEKALIDISIKDISR